MPTKTTGRTRIGSRSIRSCSAVTARRRNSGSGAGCCVAARGPGRQRTARPWLWLRGGVDLFCEARGARHRYRYFRGGNPREPRQRAAYHRLDVRAPEMRADQTVSTPPASNRIPRAWIASHSASTRAFVRSRVCCGRAASGSSSSPWRLPAVAAHQSVADETAALPGRLQPRDRLRAQPSPGTRSNAPPVTSVTLYPYHLLYRAKRFLPERALSPSGALMRGCSIRLPALRRYAREQSSLRSASPRPFVPLAATYSEPGAAPSVSLREFGVIYFGNDWFAENRAEQSSCRRAPGAADPRSVYRHPRTPRPKSEPTRCSETLRKLLSAVRRPRQVGERLWHLGHRRFLSGGFGPSAA